MATKRNYPNDYFAWYNDDNRLAIVARVLTSDVANSAETTTDSYDTYTGSDITQGLRMHYHSKYTQVSSITDNLTTGCGVDSGLHPSIVDYVKSRILEDMGDLQTSQYFRQKYEVSIKQYPHRKTGVRNLSVPRL
tara:strand:+ start:553 stop:957 length:405 start_codon:yes stop_codon:yes gene_type:complete